MTPIEVFADITCPFTHLGLRRLRAARKARSSRVPVRVRAWPLELINGVPLAADLVALEIDALRAEVAPDLYAGFEATTFPPTSLPAFGLVAAAYARDDETGEAVSYAVRDALFEQGRDVSDAAVLRTIGSAHGVEPLDRDAMQAAVLADWERGKARGVQGSPHFFVADREWFCPSLDIRHERDRYHVRVDVDAMRDFYTAALG